SAVRASAGVINPARTRSAWRSRSVKTRLAASSVRHPVGNSTTTPLPSRYLATNVDDSIRTRSPASVNGAVRVFPFPSRRRARASPLRVMTSASPGNGLVTDFRKTVPMSFAPSLNKLQAEVPGEPIGHVEPKRALAPNEPHDAPPGNPGLTLQAQVWHFALDDRSS